MRRLKEYNRDFLLSLNLLFKRWIGLESSYYCQSRKFAIKFSSTLSFWVLKLCRFSLKRVWLQMQFGVFIPLMGLSLGQSPRWKMLNLEPWLIPLVLVVTQQLNVRNMRLKSLYGVDQRSLNKLSSPCPKLKTQTLNFSRAYKVLSRVLPYPYRLEREMTKRNKELSPAHNFIKCV